MPIDAGIYGQFQPPPPIDPMRIAAQAQQLRIQRESADTLAEQRREQTERTRQLTEKARLDADKAAKLTELFGSGQPVAPSALYGIVGPEDGSKILKGLLDLRTSEFDSDEKFQKSVTTRLAAIKAMPEAMRAGAWDTAVKDYARRGIDVSAIPPYSPETLDAFEQQMLSPKERYDIAHPKPVERDPYKPLVNPMTGAEVSPAQPREPVKPASAQEYEYAKTQGYKGTFEQYQNADANRRASAGRAPTYEWAATPDGKTALMTPDEIRKSGAGKPLSAADAQEKRKYENAAPVLGSIAELSERINTQQGLLAKITGEAEKIAAKANYDDDVAEYQALVEGFAPLVARSLGHTGVLTQKDVDSVKEIFPKPGDSKTLRDRKLKRISTILGGMPGGQPASDAARDKPDVVPDAVKSGLAGKPDGSYRASDGTEWVVKGGVVSKKR